MKNLALCTVLFSLLIIPTVHASVYNDDSTHIRRWYLPHYIPIQFAGNIGFLSTGVGFESKNLSYNAGLLYGYVPKSVAGTYVHTIALKNNFPTGHYSLNTTQILIPYVGLGIMVEVGGNAFFTMPSNFPDSYYDFPKNLHALAYGGLILRHVFIDDVKLLRGLELYVEAGTIDVYVWYNAISSDIRFRDIFSVSFGVNLLLSR